MTKGEVYPLSLLLVGYGASRSLAHSHWETNPGECIELHNHTERKERQRVPAIKKPMQGGHGIRAAKPVSARGKVQQDQKRTEAETLAGYQQWLTARRKRLGETE